MNMEVTEKKSLKENSMLEISEVVCPENGSDASYDFDAEQHRK